MIKIYRLCGIKGVLSMSHNEQPKKYEFLSEDPNVKIAPIIVSLIIGAFFAVLNETLLNIALTTLMKEFDISLTSVQWMATGFMLVMGVVLRVCAFLLQCIQIRQMLRAS